MPPSGQCALLESKYCLNTTDHATRFCLFALLYALALPPALVIAGIVVYLISTAHPQGRGMQHWLAQPQVLQLFLANSRYKEASIRKAMTEGATAGQYRQASAAELAWLKEQGVVTANTTRVQLISLSRAKQAARTLGMAAAFVAQLDILPMSQVVSLAAAGQDAPAMAAAATPSTIAAATASAAHTHEYSTTATAPQLQPQHSTCYPTCVPCHTHTASPVR